MISWPCQTHHGPTRSNPALTLLVDLFLRDIKSYDLKDFPQHGTWVSHCLFKF